MSQTYIKTLDGKEQENFYDGESLRAGLTENGKHTTFLFHNGEILAECDGESAPIRRHVRGSSLSYVQTTFDSAYHTYHQDEQGSTAYITGQHKTAENCYQYDAFGNLTEKHEGIENRILYTGQQYDQETGQYYLRARYYNPVVGRFLQEDIYRGDGLNLYAYCANNPVMYYDPSGHQKCEGAEQNKPPETQGNQVGNGGGIPSGYYQDATGKWHRPDGCFASNAEVGLPSNSDHYLNRPYIRQETIDAVNANTKVDYDTGQIYDSISRKWVDPSNVELGHTTGNEFAYYRDWAESQGMTQQQFNDYMNNPEFYAWQDIYSNRSHKFEEKH